MFYVKGQKRPEVTRREKVPYARPCGSRWFHHGMSYWGHEPKSINQPTNVVTTHNFSVHKHLCETSVGVLETLTLLVEACQHLTAPFPGMGDIAQGASISAKHP